MERQRKRQTVWGWPAVANFILGGTGTGIYLFSAFCELLRPGRLQVPQPGAVGILGPVLVCLGFLALTPEAGRPLRGVNLLRNLRRSWMSVEVLTGGIFIFSATLDYFQPGPILHIFALSAALGLTISQGFIIYGARGITAWNVPLVPLIFVLSGFVTGGGLLLTLSALQNIRLEEGALILLRTCLILDTLVWAVYLINPRNPDFSTATNFLRRPLPLIVIIGLGRLFPLSLLAWVLMWVADEDPVLRLTFLAVAGLFILAGGAGQKIGIILGANFFREIAFYDDERSGTNVRGGL